MEPSTRYLGDIQRCILVLRRVERCLALFLLQFAALHDALGDPYSLPPKNTVFNAIIPSAWVDDELIAERKDGLLAYLNSLLRSSRYQASSKLLAFLNPNYITDVHGFDDEITPSMICKANLTIKAPVSRLASPVAAAYYPDWSAWSNPPNKVDFSKFDILFFGTYRIS